MLTSSTFALPEASSALQRSHDRDPEYAPAGGAATAPATPSSCTAIAAGTLPLYPWCLDDDNGGADDKKSIRNNNDGSVKTGDTAAVAEESALAGVIDPDNESAPVVANVYVYAISEYYDVPQLKAYALEKLLVRVALMGGWPAEGLVLALQLAVNLVREGDMLYDLVCSAAVEHAASLVAHPRFKQLLRTSGAFAEYFTGALAAQREQLDTANRKLAAEAAALRAQLDEGKKKHAAEAASLRAQLDNAQEKLAAERTRRHQAESAHNQQVERCRLCQSCNAPAFAGAGSTAQGRGGAAAQTRGNHTAQPSGRGRGSNDTAQPTGRGRGGAAPVQQLGRGRGSNDTVPQLGRGRGSNDTVPQLGRGRGSNNTAQQPGGGRGGHDIVQLSGRGRGGNDALQQSGGGRGNGSG